MRKKVSKVLLIGSVLICLTIVFVVFSFLVRTNWNIGRKILDNYLMDNKIEYLSCQEMPTREAIQTALDVHQNEVNEIKNISPDIEVIIGDYTEKDCGNHSKIVIYYGSHETRVKIEELINSQTFYGIPFDLVNY